jgi:hypothetical protein
MDGFNSNCNLSLQALATADQIATVPGMSWISTLHGGAIAGFVSDHIIFFIFVIGASFSNSKDNHRSMATYPWCCC